jgi:hypothetical protein
MRSDLIRFGNCLFLNSQKRQYRIVGWPCISPAVKDSEIQVCCIAECICLEESNCMYVWIVLMFIYMEPKYSLSFLDLIFGNQGLTQKKWVTWTSQPLVSSVVPTTIKSMRKCGHTLSEPHLFQKIRGYLDQILLGRKEEWELLHSSAKTFLLQIIYKNPSHFAGWFLKTIQGNLFFIVLCLLNKTIPAWHHILVPMLVGLSWSKYQRYWLARDISLPRDNRRTARPFLEPAIMSRGFKIRLPLDDETTKKNSPNMRTRSCGFLSTKQVVIFSLSSMRMLQLYGQMGNLKLAMSMSLSAVARGVLANVGSHSITSAGTDCALTVNWI